MAATTDTVFATSQVGLSSFLMRDPEKPTKAARIPARPIYRLAETVIGNLGLVLVALSGALSLLSGLLFSGAHFPGDSDFDCRMFIWALALAILDAGSLVSIEVVRRKESERATEEGTSFQLAVQQGFGPSLTELAKLAGLPSDNRQRSYQRVIDDVGRVLPLMFEDVDVRVVVYRLVKPARAENYLKVEGRDGRPGLPKNFVDNDGGRGESALKWLNELDSRFVPDIHATKLPGWEGSGKGYRTFISAAIHADGKPLGMLTVDAPEPGDLDETDRTVVEAFAALLSVNFVLVKR